MDPKARKKITQACLLIVNNQICFIDGCRKIVDIRNQFSLEEDPDFLPFFGVVSETDDYPEKVIREHFSESYLKKIDEEVAIYISTVRPSVIEACKILISKYKVR